MQAHLLIQTVLARPSPAACPPSCATNDLLVLLDTYCSDKGTFWQSKHHYGTAYHSIFGSIRDTVASVLEVGIGEDTAPSVATWSHYFPNAHIYPIDIKTKREVSERAKPGGATDRLVKHQAQFGCEYNYSMWSNPRVHLTLETDASVPEQLRRVQLPESIDIIIDDGSHKYLDQEATLHTLWPRLRDGGFYIIEDMLVGALPWDAMHAQQVPSSNTNCGAECFFPQRIAEHPFMFDRFGHQKGAAAPKVSLTQRSKDLLRGHDWFWVVTGVHQGGGLDCAMVIRKSGQSLGGRSATGPTSPSSSSQLEARTLLSAQHQLDLAVKQQAALQSRQASIDDNLKRALADAASLLDHRKDRNQESNAPTGTATGLLESIVYLLLLLSICLNLVLLSRQRKNGPTR
ncbi:hypothetical protein AB1Y20_020256 [Prymnesium parvum]|uniref:Uncharacterized protein n=1 Tax=Prymnesium parvum TaxID=97485 RepID=A0AB34JWE5_PRYPA|mmetsp:Transcript_2844/g.5935  ORF Transcript_2844/g.5935 Transcript_2844/m.5935 type:complete len:402 (-) Transcript_2844:420-1625(-)